MALVYRRIDVRKALVAHHARVVIVALDRARCEMVVTISRELQLLVAVSESLKFRIVDRGRALQFSRVLAVGVDDKLDLLWQHSQVLSDHLKRADRRRVVRFIGLALLDLLDVRDLRDLLVLLDFRPTQEVFGLVERRHLVIRLSIAR